MQGVGFRYAAYRQAMALDLAGWIRNCADGSVEAELEGARAALERFLAWCNEGPPLARVQSVSAVWSSAGPEYSSVEIR